MVPRVGLASVAALVLAACGEGSEPGTDVEDAAVGASVLVTAEATPDPTATTMTEEDDESSGDAGAVRDGDLYGRQFVAQSIEGHQLVPGSLVLLEFDDGWLTLHGCNFISNSYALDGEMLTMGRDASTTAIGCEDALLEQDDLFMNVLILAAGPMPLTLDGGELVFETSSGRVTFLDREIADPDAPLEGTRWIRVATERKGGWFHTAGPAALTITDGTAELDNGCLSGFGPVEVASDVITFGPLTATGPDCE